MKIRYHNDILCVEARFLVDNGIVSASNYYQMNARGQLNLVRRACRCTPALIEYSSMPEHFKSAVVKILGYDPATAARANEIADAIVHDAKAREFFDSYLREDGTHLPFEKREEYYANAIVLSAIHRLTQDRTGVQKTLGNGSKGMIWKNIAGTLSRLEIEKFPHSLPLNDKRLREKVRMYVDGGCATLIHRGIGNKNKNKVDDDVKESVLIEFISDPRNLDNAQVAECYNEISKKMEWQTISPSTVGVWREKFNLESAPGRGGVTNFRNKRSMQNKRTAPSFPMMYWTLDGWDSELFYQDVDKTGAVSYYNRLTIVVVLDACTKYPVGYAIGTHENAALITSALRNAVNHTKDLFGARYRTAQIQSDHYAIKTMTPFYEAVSKHFTPARVKNSKTKIIEPYFKHLNKTYCQLMPNWSGFGVTSQKNSQPNMELMQKFHKQYPDKEGCVMQLERIIAMERQAKVAKYMKLWSVYPLENKLPLSTEDYLFYFGDSTRKNMLEPQGLTPTFLGAERFYDSFDINFRKHDTVQWTVKYDPDDLSETLAVNDDGSLRFLLKEKHLQPMALAERTVGDAERLAEVNRFNKALEQHIIDVRCQSSEQVRELFANNPKLSDTTAKFVLADSFGQHKDNKNRERLLAAKQTAELPERVLVDCFAGSKDEDDDTNYYNRY